MLGLDPFLSSFLLGDDIAPTPFLGRRSLDHSTGVGESHMSSDCEPKGMCKRVYWRALIVVVEAAERGKF